MANINKKKKILFYTDCYMFGGCEKTLFEVLSAPELNKQFDYQLIYRTSREYVCGLKAHLKNESSSLANFYPVRFPDKNSWAYFLERHVSKRIILGPCKALAMLFLDIGKPLIFCYEVLILYWLFKRAETDIVHVNNGGYPGALSCLAAVIAAKLARKKNILLSVHNMASKPGNIFARLLDLWVIRSVDHVITGSKASGSALNENRGFSVGQLINIYHGIKTPQVSAAQASEKTSMIMVARFEERKGHKNVLLAFKNLLSSRPEFSGEKLILIGDGPLLEKVKTFAADEKMLSNVLFLGHRDDYIDHLAASKFLLNPSLSLEDLPYVIIEAMSLGVPAIGTYVAGIPEEIDDKVSGLLVQPGDLPALTSAIRTLLEDEQLTSRMGQAAKNRFETLFTFETMIKKYCDLYSDLATA